MPAAALAAPLGASRRCSSPLVGKRLTAWALGGFCKTQSPSTQSSSSASFTIVPRAAPSDARDALSSSLRDDEKAALEAFLSQGGDDDRAKALMVEAATTKVRFSDRLFFSFFFAKNSTLSLSLRPFLQSPPSMPSSVVSRGPCAFPNPQLTPLYRNNDDDDKKTQEVEGDLLLGALAHLLSRGDAATSSDLVTAADVDGSWELPWASIAPIKAWRYIPVPEFFDVALGQQVGLRSNVFSLFFEFQGPMRPGGWDATNQAITFQFTRQKVGIGGTESPFVDKELANKKGDRVYRFFGFQKQEGVVGARSSGGPLVLLRKVSR